MSEKFIYLFIFVCLFRFLIHANIKKQSLNYFFRITNNRWRYWVLYIDIFFSHMIRIWIIGISKMKNDQYIGLDFIYFL